MQCGLFSLRKQPRGRGGKSGINYLGQKLSRTNPSSTRSQIHFRKILTLDDYVFGPRTGGSRRHVAGTRHDGRGRRNVDCPVLFWIWPSGRTTGPPAITLLAQVGLQPLPERRWALSQPRAALPPFADLNRTVLNDLLDTQKPVVPYAARAAIRTQLGMPAETSTPHAATISTNQVAPAVLSDTNTPAPNSNRQLILLVQGPNALVVRKIASP
jgi:hypothetical protein